MTRVMRGLFRLWVVLSVLWIGGVGVMTWMELPRELTDEEVGLTTPRTEPNPASKEDLPDAPWVTKPAEPTSRDRDKFDPAEFRAFKTRAVVEHGVALAFIPPVLTLAIASAFVWVGRGFRHDADQ